MNASEFVIGTVRLSSAASQSSHGHMITVVVPADIVCVGM